MSNQNVFELKNLNQAFEEFIAGKYILADVKIASILKLLSADEKVSNIISNCLDGYNFDSEFENMIVENDNGYSLNLPVNEKDIIAFVYSLLYKFNNKSIDIYEFVTKFFTLEDQSINQAFVNFSSALILPFKNALNSIYSKRHIIVEANAYQSNYYNKIKGTVLLISKEIDSFKLKDIEKEEFNMLLNSLYLASEKNDKKLVFSIMIALDYFSRINKKTRNAYKALEECFSV